MRKKNKTSKNPNDPKGLKKNADSKKALDIFNKQVYKGLSAK